MKKLRDTLQGLISRQRNSKILSLVENARKTVQDNFNFEDTGVDLERELQL
jgi:hypothetical protein